MADFKRSADQEAALAKYQKPKREKHAGVGTDTPKTLDVLLNGRDLTEIKIPYKNGVHVYLVKRGSKLKPDGRPLFEKDIVMRYVVFNQPAKP